ncbi:MAG TPA: response regulator [Candidatus Limnocylindrales bacterium]|jgi:two-component system response regulator FixJ|nr:response regulator [Candidatus Limnocylindrales bacterium]
MEDTVSSPGVVHVVDDHEGIRVLVQRALDSVGIECIGWEGPAALLAALDAQKIDALVVDIRLVGMSGIELVRRMRDHGVTPPVIFISGVDEVPVAIEAMKLGAHDFLPKPFSAQALIDTVQSALRTSRVEKGRDARVAAVRSLVAKLSPRERQVLLAVVDGKANKVVAMELGLSEKTVEEHRSHVMSKLGATSVPDLVKLAILAGLCDPASAGPARQT